MSTVHDTRARLVAALKALIPLAQREAAHLADTDCVDEAEAAQAVIDKARRLITQTQGEQR